MAIHNDKIINVLNTDLARFYTHLHPILLLSGSLVLLAVLQILYAVLCLPATGSHTPLAAKGGAPKKPARSKNNSNYLSRITPAILSLALSLFLGTPLLTALLILFGAPIATHIPQTILCAAHISLLASLPLIYTSGVDTDRWRRVAALMIPIDEVFGAAVGCVLGAWMGAIPIPLDWNREWQKWPVTIVTGAYGGWAAGKVVGSLLRGKVIDLGA